jgi:uncharacterized ferritin-like protein (DUF455 family)
MINPLVEPKVKLKVEYAKAVLNPLNLKTLSNFKSPDLPSRDVMVLKASELPSKKGLSYDEGKARLIHDLASIELQAMELGLRSLIEFSKSKSIPEEFFLDLARVTYEESIHLGLCLETLELYGKKWGDYPVHLGLWNVSRKEDTIVERLLKVHRYLEGSGLDASFSLLKRVKGVPNSEPLVKLISRIAHDELSHVQFGSRWFKRFCEEKGLSPISECKRILRDQRYLLPRRRERINEELRIKAGFTKEEIQVFSEEQKAVVI